MAKKNALTDYGVGGLITIDYSHCKKSEAVLKFLSLISWMSLSRSFSNARICPLNWLSFFSFGL